MAEIDGARVAVEVAAGAAGDESPDAPGRWPGSHAEAGAVAPLLRVGPGWVSVAEGEWSLVSGDPAACALSLGRIADAQWRPEPGVLPVAARRALGPAARRDPRGAAWEGSGGRRRGAGRFTALAFALAAGAAWLAASRRG